MQPGSGARAILMLVHPSRSTFVARKQSLYRGGENAKSENEKERNP